MVPVSLARADLCERAWMRGLCALSAPRSCPAELSAVRAELADIAGGGAGPPAPTEAPPLA